MHLIKDVLVGRDCRSIISPDPMGGVVSICPTLCSFDAGSLPVITITASWLWGKLSVLDEGRIQGLVPCSGSWG